MKKPLPLVEPYDNKLGFESLSVSSPPHSIFCEDCSLDISCQGLPSQAIAAKRGWGKHWTQAQSILQSFVRI